MIRLHPAWLSTLLLSACLTPTEGTGRFGEARVQPEFAAGDSPDERHIQVDSMRTVMVRGSETVVNALMTYEEDASQAWILELQNDADSVQVTLELLVGSNVAYRGTRKINVVEGTPGRAPVEDVPVSLIETEFAASVQVTPNPVVLSRLGATRQLNAEVRDRDGVVIDKPVAWSSANDNVATVDAQGVVTAVRHGVTNVLATVDGVSGNTTVIVDTALAGHATITADSASIAADGIANTRITVHLLDSNGVSIGVSAGTVTLFTTLGRLSSPATDHGDGTYTATLTSDTVSGLAVVTGQLNGVDIGDDATVVFRQRGGNAKRTTIDADSVALDANGKSRTLITVRVLDASGQPVAGNTDIVVLHTTLGTLSGVSPQSDGTYTASLVAGMNPGLAIVTGTLNNQPIADSAFVVMRIPPGNPGTPTATLTADSAAIDANGVASTLITVLVSGNNPGVVVVTSSLGTMGPVTPHANGRYTARLTAGLKAGTAVVTGTLNGQMIADTARVVFRPGPGDPTTTTITADSAALNRGGATTRVLVSVLDAHGNPVGASAGVVLLTTTIGKLSAVTDHGDGTYTAIFTSPNDAGTARIRGTLNGVAINSSATVQVRP